MCEVTYKKNIMQFDGEYHPHYSTTTYKVINDFINKNKYLFIYKGIDYSVTLILPIAKEILYGYEEDIS